MQGRIRQQVRHLTSKIPNADWATLVPRENMHAREAGKVAWWAKRNKNLAPTKRKNEGACWSLLYPNGVLHCSLLTPARFLFPDTE
jgi:hypothetical protein